MSIRNKRAGRQSWQTRVEYNDALAQAAGAIGTAKWKFDTKTTKAMIIERTAKATGKTEVITFSQSYGELSMWMNIAFANISEDGFSDMLAETFLSGARVFTPKAEYRLWIKPVKTAEPTAEEEYFYQVGEIDRYYQDVV